MIQPQYAQAFPQPATGASAVTINIVEPKAYGAPQQEMAPNYTNQMYNYPQASAYAQNPMQNPGYYQQYAFQPQMPYAYPQQQYQAPQMQYEYPQQQSQAFNVAPVPQQNMPAPLIQPGMQPEVQQAPQGQPEETPVQQPQATTQSVQIEQPKPAEQVDVNALVQGLRSSDPAVQEEAITKAANLSQGAPEIAQQVLNDQVMQALVDILKDGAGQQPQQAQSPAFTGLFNRKSKKAKAAEAAASQQPQPQPAQEQMPQQPAGAAISPQDKNKVLASLTLAIYNKMFRDEYDKFKQQQGPNAQIKDLQINELPGFGEFSNIIQSNPSPDLRAAAIYAISYVAKPEDKAVVESTFQPALNDKEPLIQQTAKEAMSKIGEMQPQQVPAQPAA